MQQINALDPCNSLKELLGLGELLPHSRLSLRHSVLSAGMQKQSLRRSEGSPKKSLMPMPETILLTPGLPSTCESSCFVPVH